MSLVIIKMTDGGETGYTVDDSRDGIIKDFCKGTKTDDYAGTWSDADRKALYDDPPTTIQCILANDKRYLLSEANRLALTEYISSVADTVWDKVWGPREDTLMEGFSDDVPKDGNGSPILEEKSKDGA